MPSHLQQVIERYEMIMQLDLTRHATPSTWSAPTGRDMLQEWIHNSNNNSSRSGGSGGDCYGNSGSSSVGSSPPGSPVGGGLRGIRSTSGGEGIGSAAGPLFAGAGAVGGVSGSGSGGGQVGAGAAAAAGGGGKLVSLEVALHRAQDLPRMLEGSAGQVRGNGGWVVGEE